MKKMLFGLLALSLSASIFAATETATMQVQAQLEVVPATTDLVIENLTTAGGWNVVGSAIVFDHGRVVKGETVVPTPEINENFRVRRGNNDVLGAGTLTVDFTTTAANGISEGTLASGSSTIAHQFETIPGSVTTATTTTSVPFHVKSKVATLAGTEAVGVHTRVETVTVTLTPTPTPEA